MGFRFHTGVVTVAIILAGFASPSQANGYEHCLLEAIGNASGTETVADIRQQCVSLIDGVGVHASAPALDEPKGIIRKRLALEQAASTNRFAVIQHKSSYILPVTFNDRVNNAPFLAGGEEGGLQDYEIKFQFSLKAQLFDAIMHDRGRFFFAYTNQSYWQAYDQENSGPFRETNHEPEVFVDVDQNINLGEWHVPLLRLGWVHQSNGRSSPLSRSWNRIYAQAFFEKDDWAVSFRPWVRVGGDSAERDNPDIDAFLGNFELGIYHQGSDSTTSVLFRNNLRSENRSGIELNWSRSLPSNNKIRLVLQYFYGYGESLIDYNVITNRIGIGLQLSDFL